MPYCEVTHYHARFQRHNRLKPVVQSSEPVSVFYQLYGHGDIKVLLIIGLAATHEAWGPQILQLAGTNTPNDDEEEKAQDYHTQKQCDVDASRGSPARQTDSRETNSQGCNHKEVSGTGIQVCAFDNRGVGRSSVPQKKSEYTTMAMALDALAIMDHLGWEKAHVFGHSMGAMISVKLAATVPHRIASLALLSVTGGGYQCFPKIDKTFISIAIRFAKAKTPEERAHVDLDTHYTKDFLDVDVGGISRRTLLYKEYVKNISSSGMQSRHGLNGQINACWTHQITTEELQRIQSSGILTSVIHGRYDVVAQIRHARAIAKKLHPVARFLELPGAHLVSHQNTPEVNQELLELINASESSLSPSEWSKNSDLSARSKWSSFRIGYFKTDETEKREDSCGCCTFLVSFCQWLLPERCSTFFKRSSSYFEKQE